MFSRILTSAGKIGSLVAHLRRGREQSGDGVQHDFQQDFHLEHAIVGVYCRMHYESGASLRIRVPI